jgi:ribosome maturation factor RimP
MASPGRDWTDDELDRIVADYFRMLGEEIAGISFNKAAHNRALRNQIDRSKGSVEFKHQKQFLSRWVFRESGDTFRP